MTSLALLEFTSMAEGLKYTNDVLKAVDLELTQSDIMCPGKYIVLLAGQAQQVKTAVDYASKPCYKSLIGKEEILKMHPEILASFNKSVAFVAGENYGIIETKRFVSSIKMADAIATDTGVTIEKVHNRLGLVGKGLVIFSGTSADLKMAKKLIESEFDKSELVGVELLHTVKENIFKI